MILQIKEMLIKFQLSYAYPVIFAALCAISGISPAYVYIPLISLLVLFVIFSAFFVKDGRVFLPPMFMIYYSLGTDLFVKGANGLSLSFNKTSLIFVIVAAAVSASVLIPRLIGDGTLKYVFRRRGPLFWSIAAIDIAFLTNGLFSSDWSVSCLVFGSALALIFTFFALILQSVILKADKDVIPYTCFVMVMLAYAVFVQIISRAVSALMSDSLFIYYGQYEHWIINRSCFSFSWGVATIVGAVPVLGIPAALYLAKDRKYPAFYYISAILFFLVSIPVNTRSAMLAGALALLIGIILICCKGKNRRFNLIFTLSLAAVSLVTVMSVGLHLYRSGTLMTYIREIWLMLLRFETLSDRLGLAGAGIADLLSSPLFGVGFFKGSAMGAQHMNVFGNMYHNVAIQFAASMGICGILAFAFHLKDYFLIWLKRPNIGRTLLVLLPLMVLFMSLVDNFFFYPNFQILYIAFLSLAQKGLEDNQKSV